MLQICHLISHDVGVDVTFNSLFEMPHGSHAPWSNGLLLLLSILYLRCLDAMANIYQGESSCSFNSLFEMPSGGTKTRRIWPTSRRTLSILYLRCRVQNRLVEPQRVAGPFNSLFEMPANT